jgi:hypothetical protein
VAAGSAGLVRFCVVFWWKTAQNTGKSRIRAYGLEFLIKGLEFLSNSTLPERTQKAPIEAASISFFLNSPYLDAPSSAPSRYRRSATPAESAALVANGDRTAAHPIDDFVILLFCELTTVS